MGCGLHEVNTLLGKKWTFLILQELYHHPKSSFNQLKRAVKKPTNKILSARLHQMEQNGLLQKTILQQHPLKVEYLLTEKGGELSNLVLAMKTWGAKYEVTPPSCPQMNCNGCERQGKTEACISYR